MMKFFYLLVLSILFLSSCSSYKEADNKIKEGKYAAAFLTSIKVFQKDNSQKKKDKQLILLQTSYLKANEENEYLLQQLKSRSNPDYKKIYNEVRSLANREALIKPFLPLVHNGKELKFPIKNYDRELIIAKENYLNQYYNYAEDLLNKNTKKTAREAYNYFKEVKDVDSRYRNVTSKIEESYDKGADIVNLSFSNKTGIPLPNDFENQLFSNINNSVKDFWTKIIVNSSFPRDYNVSVTLRQAIIGNDILTKNTHNYEREIQEGWNYVKDRNGNVVKDSLGNDKKTARYIVVRARVTEFFRQKEALLSAEVDTYSADNKTQLDNRPIASNFVFRSSFATLEGDERALGENADIRGLINNRPMPFPDNYQMISSCLADLRRQLVARLEQFN